MRRLTIRIIQLVLALVFATSAWAGFYAYKHGFTRKWRMLVTKEFRKRGIDLHVKRITLDPFQGIVARDVRIMDAKNPDKVFALVDRAVLDINFQNLMRKEPFLNAVDLRNADLWVPLDPNDPESERIEISRLNARLLMPPHEWYLSEGTASVYGVQISARGRLVNIEALRPSAPKKRDQKQQDAILSVIKELRKMRFPGGPPRIELEFSGDLAKRESIFAEGTLWGQHIRRGSYEIANAYAVLAYRDGVLNVKRCTIGDARGALDVSGTYDTATRRATAHVRSTLDLQALARSLKVSRLLDEWLFYSTPLIEFSSEADFSGKPEIKVLGRMALQKFGLKSTIFDSASADFSWDDGRWFVRGGKLRNRTGELSLNAMCVPGDFRATIQSTLNPNTLRPFFSGRSYKALSEWDFQQSPRIELTISGSAPEPDKCEARGEVQLGRTRMRGVPLNAASANVRIQGRAVTVENFKITRDEGSATGSAFTYDFGAHTARLTNVKTQLNTAEAAVWIDPEIAQHVAPYRFKAAPSLSINGVVNCEKGEKGKGTRLEILANAPSGMDYTFCKKTLTFPKISGRLLFVEQRLRLLDLAGTLYGGQVRGGADISLARESPGYTARIEAQDVDFASITKLYFNYESSQGQLDGVFDFRGKNSDARTLDGGGQVLVNNGNVFAIPVLGPFSGILNSIVPGMGYNTAHKAGCTFDMRDGVIATRDFLVKGKGFSMIGEGRLFFLDDKMDFNIRLNAQGLPGVLLFPVSKLFEFASDGSLSKPVWRPKRLPAL